MWAFDINVNGKSNTNAMQDKGGKSIKKRLELPTQSILTDIYHARIVLRLNILEVWNPLYNLN